MDILYQDKSIIAINKPAGLLTIRDGYNPNLPTVKSELEKDFGCCWIVHRLDKETSGIMLVARNESMHRSLNIAFQNHQIQKTYHAIIFGNPIEKEFEVNLPLRLDGDRKHRTVIDIINGKSAISKVVILELFELYALIQIIPKTGYTHQIRSHLSYSNLPILGDRLYNKTGSSRPELINRTALHAFQLSFTHPSTHLPVTIEADYPDDFNIALNVLKQKESR